MKKETGVDGDTGVRSTFIHTSMDGTETVSYRTDYFSHTDLRNARCFVKAIETW